MIEREALLEKIMVLNEQLWEGRIDRDRLNLWLRNFRGHTASEQSEHDHALLLLSNVMYFGERELRELLRSLYRDRYRYRVIQEIRDRRNRTTSMAAIHVEYGSILERTRFLAMGNPSESGSHLMYWFRQENELPSRLFVSPHELSNSALTDPVARLAQPNIQRLVFLDDLCGSGAQAIEIAVSTLPHIRRLAQNSGVALHISYLVLFANDAAIRRVRRYAAFDCVETVFELDGSYKAFSKTARQFSGSSAAELKKNARRLALAYGRRLRPAAPLGFGNGQLLLAFHHNTPDNSLPILWAGPPEHPEWHWAFQRFPKY